MSFTIVTNDNCSYCTRAKNLLHSRSTTYKEVNMQDNLFLVSLFGRASLKTVPQIWDGAKHVGGYEELKAYLNHFE